MKLHYLFIVISIAIWSGSALPANLSYHQALKDLQTTNITPDTYTRLEQELQVIQDFVKSAGAAKANRFFNKKAGWIEKFIGLRETEIQQIREKLAKKQPEVSQEEPLTLQNENLQDLLSAKKAITALLEKPLTEDSRQEIAGQIRFFENAARRLEKPGQLKKAAVFLGLDPETTTIDYITNVRVALTTAPDKVTTLKQADKIFADIILKTKDDKITAQMLIDAQKALNDFKIIIAQLNEQERTQAKELLGGLDFATYIRQMEKTYAMRLNKIPDALSEALKEETTNTEISGKEEKESKEAKEKVSTQQKATRAEERALARQQRVAGSSLPSPEFQVSLNDKNPSKFREFGIIGNSISPTYYGIPMLGHYADAFGYQMLTRIALIEYRYTDKTQKHENLIPAPLKKIIESSGIIPELYACIWIKPKDHTFDDYNLVYHTVLGDWTGKTYLNISPEVGIFNAHGANCKTSSPVACESTKPTEVNWHADPASKLGAFSPNNARFILEKAPIATFWSYMAHGGRSLITYNIIITNPDLKNKVDGIIDNNWNFDEFSLALEPIIGNGPVQTLLELAKDSVL